MLVDTMTSKYRSNWPKSGKNSHRERDREKKLKSEQEPSGVIIEIYEDFLPAGVKSSDDYRKRYQVVTVVGTEKFSILRIYLKKSLNTIAKGDILDLNKEKGNFQLVKKLRPSDWSTTLRDEIESTIKQIIIDQEVKFVNFFNKAHAVTNRLHQLKLLPNVGDKRVIQILKVRDQQEFISFEDIEERTHLNPVEIIKKRILEELETEVEKRYILFTKKYE
jgi:putative nucleotide binding protein